MRIPTLLTMALALVPGFLHAQTVELLVQDLPYIETSTDLASYLQNIFKLTLGVAVTAAVVIIIINGIRYMTSDAIGGKADAISWIKDALWGLVLAFASVLILSTINPQLVQFDFLNSLHAVSEDAGIGGGGSGTTPPHTGIPNEQQENALRAQLGLSNITFSRPCNAGEVSQNGCVTLYGLPQNAIDRLIALKTTQCTSGGEYSCDIRITGGVEPGHTTHGVGSPMVDLRRSSALTSFIQQHGTLVRIEQGGPLYSYEGSEFWDEPGGDPHWHVCFGTTCRFQ